MGKRVLSLLLIFSLLLSGCAPAASTAGDFTAVQVLQAALDVCPDAGQPHILTQDETADYVPALYGLSDSQWTDGAVAVGEGLSAFEVGVVLLAEETDGQAAMDSLDAYRVSRQGDFIGYAPDQAVLAEQGQVLLQDRYLVLLICQDPESVASAVKALLNGNTQLVGPAPLPSPSVPQDAPPSSAPSESPVPSQPVPAESTGPAPSSAPSSAVSSPSAIPTPDPAEGRYPFTQPGIDDMTLYDTTAILAAWQSGDRSALSEKDAAILAAAEEVLQAVTSSDMGAYETERAVYRWLTEQVAYDWDHQSFFQTMDPDSSNPYGALVNRKAICLGYASAFQLLMDMSGVECITVVGAAFSSQEDHAWNMVRLDGDWYCVDVTWDMGLPEKYWCYFNVTSDYMAATDHQWHYASVPEATAMDGGVS